MTHRITLTDANYGNPISLHAAQVIACTVAAEQTYRDGMIPDGVFRRTLVYLASSNQLAVRESPEEVWSLVDAAYSLGAPPETVQPLQQVVDHLHEMLLRTKTPVDGWALGCAIEALAGVQGSDAAPALSAKALTEATERNTAIGLMAQETLGAQPAPPATRPTEGTKAWTLTEADEVTLRDMLRLVRSWTSAESVMLDAERLLASLAAAPAAAPPAPTPQEKQ